MPSPVEDFAKWFASLDPKAQAAASEKFKRATGGTLSAWANPKPVAVALIPVNTTGGLRLLGLRRAIAPHKGKIALPGGFLEEGEDSLHACAREVLEETGLASSPGNYVRIGADHAGSNATLLMFCRSICPLTFEQFTHLRQVHPATSDGEASELVLIDPDTPLCFPLHQQAALGFFRTS